LARTRESSAISLAVVTSSIGISARKAWLIPGHYGGAREGGQPTQTGAGHASDAIGPMIPGRSLDGLRSIKSYPP